jgi:hypothetical protein
MASPLKYAKRYFLVDESVYYNKVAQRGSPIAPVVVDPDLKAAKEGVEAMRKVAAVDAHPAEKAQQHEQLVSRYFADLEKLARRRRDQREPSELFPDKSRSQREESRSPSPRRRRRRETTESDTPPLDEDDVPLARLVRDKRRSKNARASPRPSTSRWTPLERTRRS